MGEGWRWSLSWKVGTPGLLLRPASHHPHYPMLFTAELESFTTKLVSKGVTAS